MALAAQAGSPIKRLFLNDVGPVIAKVALERIATYLGQTPAFNSIEEAEKYIRAVSASFGPHTEAQWRFLTETFVRKDAQGKWRAHYDPRIADEYKRTLPDQDIELWYLYDAIRCPTMVLRGAQSDLLSRQTVEAMTGRGPKAKVVELAEVGHAPTLLNPDQIAIVRDFLHGEAA
jgi:pimeloyl-ACP methyl ester carboxylesterase